MKKTITQPKTTTTTKTYTLRKKGFRIFIIVNYLHQQDLLTWNITYDGEIRKETLELVNNFQMCRLMKLTSYLKDGISKNRNNKKKACTLGTEYTGK